MYRARNNRSNNVVAMQECCTSYPLLLSKRWDFTTAFYHFWFIYTVRLTFTKTEQSAVQEKCRARAFHIDCEGSGFANDCYLRDVTDFRASAFLEHDSFLHESVMLRHVDLPPVFSLTSHVPLVLLEDCKIPNFSTVASI